jgi:carboxyl-terminal processing protease
MLRSVFVLMLCATVLCAEEQKQPQKPLFAVDLEHEFPDAMGTFEEARKLILENYYSTTVDEDALYWAAIEGMLRHVSPPESPELGKLYKPEVYNEVEQGLKGVKLSIGIKSSFDSNDGSLTVTEIDPGSPAAGVLKLRDRVMRIDDKPLKGLAVADIDELLQGEAGTEVVVTLVRDISVETYVLTRAEYAANNLIMTVIDDAVGLLELRKVTAGMSTQVAAELQKLKEQKIDKLLIDLRSNTGGVFIESLRIAELFLSAKTVLLRTLKHGNKVQNYVSSTEEPYEFDIVLLVNEHTASSAEIIVAALQDAGKARVVGKKTYGKGVFEKTFKMQNDFRVKFIIGSMYSPKGKSWQSKGVLPDFAVEQELKTLTALRKHSVTTRMQKDVPLITAYKLLK